MSMQYCCRHNCLGLSPKPSSQHLRSAKGFQGQLSTLQDGTTCDTDTMHMVIRRSGEQAQVHNLLRSEQDASTQLKKQWFQITCCSVN
jgi:hypothetical protein